MDRTREALAASPFHLELGAGRPIPLVMLTVHSQQVKRFGLWSPKHRENAMSLAAMMGLVIEPMSQQVPQRETLRQPLGRGVAEILAYLLLGEPFHVLQDPTVLSLACNL